MKHRGPWFRPTFSMHLADAQQPKKVSRIGVLSPYSSVAASLKLEAFRKSLRELDTRRETTSRFWSGMQRKTASGFPHSLVTDNDGNGRRSLFGGNVKARRVLWQVAVRGPASPNVTELERSCDAATHNPNIYSFRLVERQGRLSIHAFMTSCRASLCFLFSKLRASYC